MAALKNNAVSDAELEVLIKSYLYPNGENGETLAKPIVAEHFVLASLRQKGLVVECVGGWYLSDKGIEVLETSVHLL